MWTSGFYKYEHLYTVVSYKSTKNVEHEFEHDSS